MQRVKHLKSHYVSARNVCQDYERQIGPIGHFHTEPMDDYHCYEKEETHLFQVDKQLFFHRFKTYGEVKNEFVLVPV